MSTVSTIPHPEIVSPEAWRAARVELLAEEKEQTKRYDALNAKRRRLPMVKLDKTYEFDGPAGKKKLADLFEGRAQLIVYHFMFDPKWEKGCPGCTGFVNALGDISMLAKRQTTFALISRAPLEKLEGQKKSEGWSFPWYSSFASDFNYDFHTTLDESKAPREYNFKPVAKAEGEAHGLSVFFRIDNDVYHTYSSYARGVESLTDSYRLLDVTPYGRQEDFEDSPAGWPQKPTYG